MIKDGGGISISIHISRVPSQENCPLIGRNWGAPCLAHIYIYNYTHPISPRLTYFFFYFVTCDPCSDCSGYSAYSTLFSSPLQCSTGPLCCVSQLLATVYFRIYTITRVMILNEGILPSEWQWGTLGQYLPTCGKWQVLLVCMMQVPSSSHQVVPAPGAGRISPTVAH